MTAAERPAVSAPVSGWDALRWLRSRVRLRPGRTLVGIDGLAGSGKTTFADELAALVSDCGIDVIRISLDAHLAPGSVPGEFALPVPTAFADFAEDVLQPLGGDGSGRYRLPPDGDRPATWRCAPQDAVVIVDGLFLHHPGLCEAGRDRAWDFSVWLEVPAEQAYLRLHHERGADPDPQAPTNARSYDCQLRYLAACDPAGRADLVVDTSRPHPSTD